MPSSDHKNTHIQTLIHSSIHLYTSFKREKQEKDQSHLLIQIKARVVHQSYLLQIIQAFKRIYCKAFKLGFEAIFQELLDSIIFFNQASSYSSIEEVSKRGFLNLSSYLISHILKLDFSLRNKYFQEIHILCIFIHIEP